MAQFSLPNTQTGGSQTVTANSLQDAQNIAQSQGTWSPAAGTYGANSILGGGGGGTGGSPVGTTPGAGLGPDLSGLAAFAAQTSGVTQKQLDQQKAEFDAQLQFARDQMQQLGIPQLQINQALANLQQQQFQSGLLLSQQAQQFNQAATQAALTGYYTPPAPVPSVQQWVPGAAGGAGAAGGGGGGATGSSYFVGGDGRVHVGTPQGTGQPGWGSAQGVMADPSWPVGSIVTDPTQLTQPRSAAGATSATGATNAATGTGYFVGTDGRVHVGSPSGTGQAGWGSDQGVPAAAGWAAGAQSSDPNVFLQAPGTPVAGGPQQTLAGALQQAQLSGMYQGAPTEQAREFNQNLALQQGQLGQQYLSTAAQLQGPQNTFQLSNYLRGAQGNPNVPTYLNALANNLGMAPFQATGTTPPTTQSAAGLAGQLGGAQGATPGWNYNQTLGAMQTIMNRGAQGLAPGSLESLTPDELQAFGSGLGAVGGSLPTFLQQYQQSRVGQQAPTGQPALA